MISYRKIKDRLTCDIDRWYLAVLCVILAVGWLCRSVYVHQLGETLTGTVPVGPDVRAYHERALEILGGGGLWSRVGIHAPLYPFFLAFLYGFSGVDVLAVRTIQLGIDMAGLLLLFSALWLLKARWTALAAAFCYAFSSSFMYYGAELVSEALLVFLLNGMFLCWVLARRAGIDHRVQRRCLSAATGFIAGLAVITHPLSLIFASGLILFSAVHFGFTEGRRNVFLYAGLMYGAMLVPILPVTFQNWRISGDFVFVQGHEGLNFYIGNNPEATGTCYARPGGEYDRLAGLAREQGVTGAAGTRRFYYQQAWEYIRANPVQWLGKLVRKFVFTWNAAELTSGSDLPQLRRQTALMRFPLLGFGALVPFAFAGAWFSRKDSRFYPFMVCAVCYSAALTIFVTSGRYRMGMLSAVVVLAARGGVELFRNWGSGYSRELAVAFAFLGLGFAFSFVPRYTPVADYHAEAASLRAEAAWRTGQTEKAQFWTRVALGQQPENAGINHLMGVVLLDSGKAEQALPFFDKALQNHSRRERVFVDQGVALSQLGKHDAAREKFDRATEINSDFAEAWYNLGVLAESAGDSAEALKCYQHAIDLKTSLASAHLNYAVICHKGGNWKKADSHYRIALKIEPEKVRALACRAALLAEMGNPDACKLFEKCLELNPAQREVRVAYSRFLVSLGMNDKAERILLQTPTSQSESTKPVKPGDNAQP